MYFFEKKFLQRYEKKRDGQKLFQKKASENSEADSCFLLRLHCSDS
jgi:hypothetical protein